MGQRKDWIDSARGLAFLMVIYFHLATSGINGSSLYFTPVFLSVFFFISGYLFKSGMAFGVVFEQRTRTILLPFLIFGFGGGILLCLTKLKQGGFGEAFIDLLQDLFVQMRDHRTLWFLASLYVFSLAFYWIDRWFKTPVSLLAACIVLFAINEVSYFLIGIEELPWEMHRLGFGCFFMGAGRLYRVYEEIIDRLLSWGLVAISFVVYMGVIYFMQEYIIFGGSRYVIDSILLYALGFIWFIGLSKKVTCKSNFLLFVGSNSLIYFCLHRQVLIAVQKIWMRLLASLNMEATVLTNIVEVLVIGLLLIIPVYLITKFVPQLTGKGFKLWKT